MRKRSWAIWIDNSLNVFYYDTNISKDHSEKSLIKSCRKVFGQFEYVNCSLRTKRPQMLTCGRECGYLCGLKTHVKKKQREDSFSLCNVIINVNIT